MPDRLLVGRFANALRATEVGLFGEPIIASWTVTSFPINTIQSHFHHLLSSAPKVSQVTQ